MRFATPPSRPPFPRLLSGPRRAVRRGPNARAATLFGAGALAGGAFGAVAVASARRATVGPDNRMHDEMLDHMNGRAADAAVAVAPAVDTAAKWWVYGPAALAAAAAVLAAPGRGPRTRRSRRVGAVAIAALPAVVTLLDPAFDRWLPQPPVGARRRPVDHPVFPSGHAFRATAVALAAGYVVTREEIVGPGRAWSVAVAAPALVGIARLLREKHLASDVIGGWLAGIALAGVAAGAYEIARGRGK